MRYAGVSALSKDEIRKPYVHLCARRGDRVPEHGCGSFENACNGEGGLHSADWKSRL